MWKVWTRAADVTWCQYLIVSQEIATFLGSCCQASVHKHSVWCQSSIEAKLPNIETLGYHLGSSVLVCPTMAWVCMSCACWNLISHIVGSNRFLECPPLKAWLLSPWNFSLPVLVAKCKHKVKKTKNEKYEICIKHLSVVTRKVLLG